MTTFISNENQLETFEYLHESRKKVNENLQLDRTYHHKNKIMSTDDHSIDQALLSLDNRVDSKQGNILNTNTAVSVADTSTSVAGSLNVSTKQSSLLCKNIRNSRPIESDEETIDNENHISERDEETNNVTYVKQSTDQYQNISIIKNINQQKRHIMISYNHSSIKTCRKIYDRLVEKNYKVWMDLDHMFDDILAAMAQAVENSYIVLLCINQQYYESDYCRLEAEYAAENHIKFIPCLMEEAFRPKSWLGIIIGLFIYYSSNFHIDFSSSNNFDQSFEQLIRQITYIEKQISLQPRRTLASNSMINPTIATSSSIPTTTITDNINSYKFDSIIHEYKRIINKTNYHLNELNRNELFELIIKIRQELFHETTKILLDNKQSNEQDYKEFLQQFINRTLKQNELLLKLINNLTRQQSIEQHRRNNFNVDSIFKLVFGIILLWTLVLFYQK
ncbi:unnamed protein product [Rotaria sordida]|uniref:TIR domain-containing protein n=1 Tax=Rotaria sordida TaxID=392033 RepID=A0A819RYC1_9BILA|nr:unnamed protein product [Rotaria sordida]CAF4048202.1 unnamed protein product [Rotaria sordida]